MRAAKDWVRRNPEASFLIALGALLRLPWLGHPSLSSDEACTLVIARQPLSEIPALVRALETTPALHFLLMRLWLPLWTDSLIGLRSFSVLCGIAALPLYWFICRRLTPGRERLAFALGAVSSLWIHGAQTGRCYALMLLLACAQVLLALRLRERWSGRDAWLYGAAAVCGMYTHYFYGFFLLGLFANNPRKRFLALHAAIAAAFIPGLLDALAQRRMALGIWFQNEPFTPATAARVLGTFLFDPGYMGLALPGTTALIGAAACALCLAGLWKPRRIAGEVRFCLINIAIPLAAAGLIGWINGKPAFQARYLIFLGLSIYPLLALGAWHWVLALVVSLGGTFCYFTSNLTFDPRLDSLSAFVRRASDPAEPIVHWGALEYVALRSYYLPERTHYLVDLDPGDSRYARLPGYAGLIEPDALAGMGKMIVFDPQRRAFPRRIGESTGPELLKLIRERR